jgi:predicted flap endonuclease-1-like 5' DNA nuclease
MTRLVEVEGIGEKYAQKLKEAGVGSTRALLERGAKAKCRKELATTSGISAKLILEWVNHVDLFRLRGVSSEYADLLEKAGVDTVRELAQRKAANLYQRLVLVNQTKRLVRRLPTQAQVSDWIDQAKQLPGIVTY